MFVVVPNYIRDAIYEKVDTALLSAPQFVKDRETIYQQMLEYFDVHGTVPDFKIEPKIGIME